MADAFSVDTAGLVFLHDQEVHLFARLDETYPETATDEEEVGSGMTRESTESWPIMASSARIDPYGFVPVPFQFQWMSLLPSSYPDAVYPIAGMGGELDCLFIIFRLISISPECLIE